MKAPRTQHSASALADPPSTTLGVVGIGASAGGLKALQQFVEAVPADSGMAYVVILHLDPQRESRMGELLQDRSAIPVKQVSGPVVVEPDHIYIIPPGHDLAMDGTSIGLRERGERSAHAPVDLFFRTLAEAAGKDAAGVILSGTGSDGTEGIRHIREAGGITVAQLPEEAQFDGMPASAISTGLVDLVLPAGQIPGELLRLRLHATDLNGTGSSDSEVWLARVFATMKSRTGHDFSGYKRTTVMRRLDRRLRFNGVRTLDEYQPLLKASAAESQALLRDLLISVSSFFRDPDAFEALAAHTPALFDGKGPGDSVRVWVVGCATGEEVYSIAMVLAEHADTLPEPPRFQLFATDIDEAGYTVARAGLYSSSAVAEISAERLKRFFTKEAGGYRIVKSIREQVLFAGHNVLHDPPFSRIDLISCRNLFIYLQPESQQRVLETFHFALNQGGTLFLGASETAGDSGLFTALSAGTHRLYQSSGTAHRAAPRMSAADPVAGLPPRDLANRRAVGAEPPSRQRFSYGAMHVRMLEQYAPASVVVDERLAVVHLSAGASRFLRLGEGEPNHNVLDLARADLRRVLQTALYEAFHKGKSTMRTVRMTTGADSISVCVHVRPSAGENDGATKFALILFDVTESDGRKAPVRRLAHEEAPEVKELEEELRRTRALLDAASASHDDTVAELQTVNEELQSINEEQKAAAEELETGREEIQSINEELVTINQEHQSTIEELKRTNADLQNLIESTEIGTIFLDRAMRIRRFTPAIASLFNFVAADQGRPFSHITHRLNYDGLPQDVQAVLDSLERVEREVESDSGESYIVRINPYRSQEGENEGAVLTFFSNTAQHRAGLELQEAKTTAETANLAKDLILSTLSHEFRTPLNAILGYADLLMIDGPLTPTQVTKVERIKTGGWHLAGMIEEILKFAKLDGGQEQVEVSPRDAREIAREAWTLVEASATAKKLAFILEVPDQTVEFITDGVKARQILINLCSNAVKYTASGEIRLRVRQETKSVVFEVQDTGIGIAPENHAQIFERFWQVDGGSTRAAGGMGIGLAAAREYARLLRGDVEVDSELGKGTTFRLRLPLSYDLR